MQKKKKTHKKVSSADIRSKQQKKTTTKNMSMSGKGFNWGCLRVMFTLSNHSFNLPFIPAGCFLLMANSVYSHSIHIFAIYNTKGATVGEV